MFTISASLIDAAIDESGEDRITVTDHYSGRGMFGATCLGISVNSNNGLTRILSRVADEQDRDVLLNHLRTDAMGMGVIGYFPGVELEGKSRYAEEEIDYDDDDEEFEL